jgi:hypothetical protein
LRSLLLVPSISASWGRSVQPEIRKRRHMRGNMKKHNMNLLQGQVGQRNLTAWEGPNFLGCAGSYDPNVSKRTRGRASRKEAFRGSAAV